MKELLRDKAPYVRTKAAWALVRAGDVQPGEVVPALCEALLDDEDVYTRAWAAAILEKVPPDREAARAIPVLILALNDRTRPDPWREESIGDIAERTLSRIGGPAVPALLEALEGPNLEIRRRVAWVLGEMDPEYAQEAVPALREALNKRSISAAAARALQPSGQCNHCNEFHFAQFCDQFVAQNRRSHSSHQESVLVGVRARVKNWSAS